MGTVYTNAVLTVIAGALCALVFQNMTTSAVAKGEHCGSSFSPCHVTAASSAGIDVRVVNWPVGN